MNKEIVIPSPPEKKSRGWQSRYYEELVTTPGLKLTDQELARIIGCEVNSLYCMKWRMEHPIAYQAQKDKHRKRYAARMRRSKKREADEAAAKVVKVAEEPQLELPLPLPATAPVKEDMVNHPSHYLVGGIETYDFIVAKLTPDELRGYLKGNIIKYASRAGHKDAPAQDIGKLAWYAAKLQQMGE